MTHLIDNIQDNNELKTFSIHENDLSFVRHIKAFLFQYKHLENILNILLQQQFIYNQSLITHNDKHSALILTKEIFNLLLNPVIMKAVLNKNSGGPKTRDNIAKVNHYFQHNQLFSQAIHTSNSLNDKNISMIIRRLKKDWSNYFSALKEFNYNNPKGLTGKPSYPKAKKLSQVFNYSLPLESDKFSLKKSNKGLLGITLGKKMFYVYIGKTGINSKYYFKDKLINNVTVSYSHGHIYYNFTYTIKNNLTKINENKLPIETASKVAGGDIGLNNLLSLFIYDNDTTSLIISGKELISYNCYFNKQLAKTNELISQQVKVYKTIISKVNNKDYQVPEVYTHEGKRLIKRREQLFERRKLFMADYMNKMSKKILIYLSYYQVNELVLSKNLSFVKTDGSIHMNKKTKQKFYQIPFGRLLNLLESKVITYGINITWINEAYTSKTSSLSSNVVEVQEKSCNKEIITPTDLKGNRGAKVKGKKNNKLGRGLFKDSIVNKVINADLNAAYNHVKVGLKSINLKTTHEIMSKMLLKKLCNPIKIKSNHEFDTLLRRLKIVDIQLSNDNKEIYYLT